ncbi:MAG: AlpA family transcriptional regulator [Hyphomicrobium sp.]|nr:MAG: AlpA family transcriptional regulator [Hyphomicrobium sp.]
MKIVLKRIGYGRSKFYQMLHSGDFPPGVRLGANRVAWRESLVEEWIRSRPVHDLRHPNRHVDHVA